MRRLPLIPFAAVLALAGCDKSSPDAARISELERKANEATERQRLLEQQLAEQQLAAERDAIERDRQQLEEARAELERREGDIAAAEADKLRQREQELADRESKLATREDALDERRDTLYQRDSNLDDRERDLAGREAIPVSTGYQDEPSAPVADYDMFYDSLAPYGSWFETPDYGYVYQPAVVRDTAWRPYTRGNWACSDRGWTWVSEEPFGWATYHYGRWALCRGHGWVWVPGAVWAPSWVSWRSSGSHIGWAPLPPETLAWREPHWDNSVEVTFGIGALWFSFVETRHFGHPIHHHCLPPAQNNVFISNTTNITNIYVQNRRVISGGPAYRDVIARSERRPAYYRIEEDRNMRPGRDSTAMRPRTENGVMRVAAPNVDAAWNDNLRPRKIKGRMDNIQVERKDGLKPEIATRFRESRQENRRRADQAVTELGGPERFQQARVERLETNRRRNVEQLARTNKDKPSQPLTPPRQDETSRRREDGPMIHPPKGPTGPAIAEAERIRKQQEQNGRRDDGPMIHPPKGPTGPAIAEAERIRKQQEENAEQNRRREQQERQKQLDDARRDQQRERDQQQRLEEVRRNQQRERDNQQRQEETRREQERQKALDDARRNQQRDREHQQQLEETRREQQRERDNQQRAEETRRKQQLEETRREQLKEREHQQRLEENRRQQEREQQLEENRRQQERQREQQQQEQARREQDRQQEQARREQERDNQQQQERARQQEQARQQQQQQQQQQQDDERKRRKGN